MNKMLKIIAALIVCVMVARSQDHRIVATRIKMLYCYTDIVRGRDSSCVDRVRITFRNSDKMKIKYLKFRLTISETKKNQSDTLYDAKHELSITMNPGEVYSADVDLLNPISPPDGEASFENKDAWDWNITVIRINHK